MLGYHSYRQRAPAALFRHFTHDPILVIAGGHTFIMYVHFCTVGLMSRTDSIIGIYDAVSSGH